MRTQIYNGDVLIADGRWIHGGSVMIEDDKIVEVLNHSKIQDNIDNTINAEGGYILPGGIELHVHGGGGCDFMECTKEAFETAVMAHRRHGTTSIYPTLSSSTNQMIRDAAKVCTELMEDPKSGILGLHLEGPYFNGKMAGAQLPEIIRNPDPMEYISLVNDFPCIKRWDAAPELPGADEFGRYITSKGVVAALAHTQANYHDVENAYKSGYNLATHFYNAMTGNHKVGVYKHEGTVEAVYLNDGFNVEVICDGIHVPPMMVKLVHKVKGTERMCLITDALSITESPDGSSYDPRVMVENGVCKLKDGSAIAGSCATMDRLIRVAVKEAEIPLADAARMVSETPARIMGVYDRKGSISKNKDADIIIMDRDLKLTHVIAMGDNVDLCAK
ncbi:MAG: N-acetylglucosamine-6-phosphate deacetylase [Muribaculaceae bacterium]|nr:N-acetylglucosamine-6-phosphate deacetylase [Muribaculaceae bacterium]